MCGSSGGGFRPDVRAARSRRDDGDAARPRRIDACRPQHRDADEARAGGPRARPLHEPGRLAPRRVRALGRPSSATSRRAARSNIAYEYQIPASSSTTRSSPASHGTFRRASSTGSRTRVSADVVTEEDIEDAPHTAPGKFQRYRYETEEGVSPRSLRDRRAGNFLASGNEHNQAGHISEDAGQPRHADGPPHGEAGVHPRGLDDRRVAPDRLRRRRRRLRPPHLRESDRVRSKRPSTR